MSAATTTRRCRSRAKYGRCGRPSKHAGPHGVPVGDDFWFGYQPGGKPLGYGRFNGDQFASA